MRAYLRGEAERKGTVLCVRIAGILEPLQGLRQSEGDVVVVVDEGDWK